MEEGLKGRRGRICCCVFSDKTEVDPTKEIPHDTIIINNLFFPFIDAY
jgi:hypothetical protein